MFLFIGLIYGVRSNSIGVIRDLNKRIRLGYKTHSYVSTKATDRVQFFSTETASTKEPLEIEVNTIEESKSSGTFTRLNVKKISYLEMCDIESLKEGLN